jgi:hypothetical protein
MPCSRDPGNKPAPVRADTPSAPRVSVLLPFFDEEPERLRRAAQSILNQTFGGFELLLLDDGSGRSATREASAELAAADPRVRLVRGARRGLARTLNAGLEAARGELVARQDSDDWSEPERLEEQTRFLAAHPEVAIVGTQALLHEAGGAPLWPTRLPEDPAAVAASFAAGANPFFHGSVCFRAAAARAAGGYRPELCGAEDLDLFGRMTARAPGANLPAVLYHYRFTPASVSSREPARQLLAHAAALGAKAGPEAAARAGRLRQADRTLLAGDASGALRLYARALLRAPGNLEGWAKTARALFFLGWPASGPWLFRPRTEPGLLGRRRP